MLRKRILPLALVLILLMLLPSAASAVNLTPQEREREASAIRWMSCGVPSDTKKFDPSETLSRGRAAQIFADLLGLSERAELSGFSDVIGKSEFSDEIAKCVAAGILDGVGDGEMRPNQPASREMIWVMMARALRLDETEHLSLRPELSPWARGAVGALEDLGCTETGDMSEPSTGYELFVLLNRLITDYANHDGSILTASGRGTSLVAGREIIVTGSMRELVIAPGAGDSTVTLMDATVSGTVTVCAPVTVYLSGDTAVNTVMLNVGGEQARVVGDGQAVVGSVQSALEAGSEEPEASEPGQEIEPEPEPEASPEPESEPGEEAGDEAESRPSAAPLTAESIGPAPVEDPEHPDEPPYESYSVSAWGGDEDDPYDVLIEIEMTGLRPYRSRGAGAGYWTGFSITAPEGATGYRVAYSATGEMFNRPEEYALTGNGFTRYFDAARWTQYYVKLQWTGPGFTEEDDFTCFKVDLLGVELDTSSLTERDSLLGKIGTAALSDEGGGRTRREALCADYGIGIENRKDEKGSYLELTVHAAELQRHTTAAGEGYWAGFSIAEPEGAASCRYSVYLNLETAKRNFSYKTPLSWEEFFHDVDGEGSYGIRQLTDAYQKDQRDYWAVLQWYADEAGTEPLTTAVVYHIVLDVELA